MVIFSKNIFPPNLDSIVSYRHINHCSQYLCSQSGLSQRCVPTGTVLNSVILSFVPAFIAIPVKVCGSGLFFGTAGMWFTHLGLGDYGCHCLNAVNCC